MLNVLVMAPILGSDLSFVSEVDPGIRVLDGNAAYLAELEAEGLRRRESSPEPNAAPSSEERDALFAQADVLIMSHPVLGNIASRSPRLRWFHHTQAGVSNLWRSDIWESQIVLTSSRGYVAPTSIAQYVMAGIMFFGRGLFNAYLDKRSGRLDRAGYQTIPLHEATVGIVGLGGIGKEVARLARQYSMRVLATRRSATSPQNNVEGVDLLLPADQLAEMAAQSDFLAVCTALNHETQSLIDKGIFDVMKPSAVLINISRGEIVDEDALIEALRGGGIRGVVMDVYQGELEGKPPRAELMELPQAFVTSHISSSDSNFGQAVRELFQENLRRFLADGPLLNVVDRERGY